MLAIAVTTSCFGQTFQPQHAGAELNADLVRTGLYVISGGGCNSLLRLSSDGLILVDSKLPGNYEALVGQIRKISRQPIRILIPTGPEERYTGNIDEFAKSGTAILVNQNLIPTLKEKPSLTRIYDRELPVKMGGIEVQLLHFGNARSNAETVVYFPNLKVVAVGGLLSATPDPDFSAGGSFLGWRDVLARILSLDFDVVVPGAGPVASRADLEAFRARIDTLTSRALDLVHKGVAKDKFWAQLRTDDLGWKLNLTDAQIQAFYAELSRAK